MKKESMYNKWVSRAAEEFLVRVFSDINYADSLSFDKLDILTSTAIEVSRMDIVMDTKEEESFIEDAISNARSGASKRIQIDIDEDADEDPD